MVRTLRSCAAALAVVLSAACADSPTEQVAPAAPGAQVEPQALLDAPAPNPTSAKVEVDYMEFTADHHAMGVQMSQMCLAKASRPELLELCRRNLDGQSRELAEVLQWLRDWYGIAYQPRMSANGRRDMALLQAEPNGDPFQIRFLYVFPKHHENIVQKSERLLPYLYHPELRQLASNIIVNQTRDINDMRTWACAWYGNCHTVP